MQKTNARELLAKVSTSELLEELASRIKGHAPKEANAVHPREKHKRSHSAPRRNNHTRHTR